MTQTPNIVEEKITEMSQQLNIPVEVLREQFLALSQVQRDEELKAYAHKTGKKAEKEEIPFAIIPPDENMVIHLSDVIYLDETPIPDASEAMRALNAEWVETLEVAYQTTPDELPPVVFTNTTRGALNLDGRHRLAAQENNVKAEFVDENGKIPQDKRKAYQAAREAHVVRYKWVECASEADAVMYAFRANLKNGLTMGKSNRARFALWLQRQAEKAGLTLSDRQAAIEAGTTHSNVSQLRSRTIVKYAESIIAAESEGKKRDSVKMPADFSIMPDDSMKKVNAEIKRLKHEAEKQGDKPLENALEKFFPALITLHSLLNDAEALAPSLEAWLVADENAQEAARMIIDALDLALESTAELQADIAAQQGDELVPVND